MSRLLLCILLLTGAGCGRDPNQPQWRLTSWRNLEYQSCETTPTGVKGVSKTGRIFEYTGHVIKTQTGDRNIIAIRECIDDNSKRVRTEFIITRSGK